MEIFYQIILWYISAFEGQLPSLVGIFMVITHQVIPIMFNQSCYIQTDITVTPRQLLLKFIDAVNMSGHAKTRSVYVI